MQTRDFCIATPLGELTFVADATVEASSQLSLTVAPYQPSLPNGMSVEGCYCALLRIDSPPIGTVISLKAQLQSNEVLEYGPETGEGLEAQAWYNKQTIMQIGTEDVKDLHARLRECIDVSYDPFEYSANSLSVQIKTPLNIDSLSLHLIVAWNTLPEPLDCSCWFAVDQRHSAVTSAFTIA